MPNPTTGVSSDRTIPKEGVLNDLKQQDSQKSLLKKVTVNTTINTINRQILTQGASLNKTLDNIRNTNTWSW
jgi:hypothetical protein